MSSVIKIFVIGFNKTGTCSIQKIFKSFSINSIHTTTPVLEIIDQYDAFCDGNHVNFIDYYNKYPNSLFILNTRPLGKWLISRYKHAKGRNFAKSWCWPITTERTLQWIQDRHQHHKNIFNFFRKFPKQLFVVNIERDNWQSHLMNFIGDNYRKKYDNLDLNEIHRNKIDEDNFNVDILNQIITNVHKSLHESSMGYNELLFKGYNIEKFKWIKMYL